MSHADNAFVPDEEVLMKPDPQTNDEKLDREVPDTLADPEGSAARQAAQDITSPGALPYWLQEDFAWTTDRNTGRYVLEMPAAVRAEYINQFEHMLGATLDRADTTCDVDMIKTAAREIARKYREMEEDYTAVDSDLGDRFIKNVLFMAVGNVAAGVHWTHIRFRDYRRERAYAVRTSASPDEAAKVQNAHSWFDKSVLKTYFEYRILVELDPAATERLTKAYPAAISRATQYRVKQALTQLSNPEIRVQQKAQSMEDNDILQAFGK